MTTSAASKKIESREIEAKFTVTSPTLVAALRSAAQLDTGHPLADAHEVGMVDTYLDTPDFRLLRQGYGLRIRTVSAQAGPEQRLATVKSRRLVDAGSLFQRLEIEEPLPVEATADPLRGWPEAIMQVLLPLLDGEDGLQPICELRQVRTKRAILAVEKGSGKGTGSRRAATPPVVGELSFDRIAVHAGPAAPALAQFEELEVELARGRAEAELHTIVEALSAALKLAPSAASKLELALQIAAHPPVKGTVTGSATHSATDSAGQPALHPALPMAEACRLIWREQLTAMLLTEAGVRYSDDPEYVHDMRVATRRARAAAKLYGDYFRPKAVKHFLEALRRTARLLGAVRDLDVAIGKLARFERRSRKRTSGGKAGGKSGAKPATNSASIAVLQETLATWRSRRAAAHAALMEWLDSPRYAKFIVRFAAFCHTPGAGARSFTPKPDAAPTPYQVRHVAPSMVLNRFESVRCFEALFDPPAAQPAPQLDPGEPGAAAPAVPVEVLHQLRIECKYLRYNLEFMESLLGPQATHLIHDLRKLQQDLGDLNDAAVSQRLIADLHGLDGSAVERYVREQERTIRRLSARVPADLRTFVSHLNRRRLALAIAWL